MADQAQTLRENEKANRNFSDTCPDHSASRFPIGSIAEVAVSDSRLGIDRGQPKRAGPVRRILFQPGRARESYGYQDGSTLFFQPPGASSAVPLEATAEDKFQIEDGAVFTFEAAKNQMTVNRRGGERVFTKEK